jgi:uncharacterized repeat protein (TIGR04076 family)
MSTCRITVIKRTLNAEIAQEYCQKTITACDAFKEGQVFTCGIAKPEGFCDWAWINIQPFVAVLLSGGNFSTKLFPGWMKRDDTMIACCADGVRPVVFKLERMEG